MSNRRVRGWFAAEEPNFRWRGVWLLLAFLAVAALLVGRLVDVQYKNGRQYAALAAHEHNTHIVLPAERGQVTDRTGRLLVSNQTVWGIFADPGSINASQRTDVATQLAKILPLSPGKIIELVNRPGRFVYLVHGQSSDVKNKLTALDLPGIGTIPEKQSVYNHSPVPGTSFAADLLGYVNHDGNGQYGVEGYYNQQLKGTDGSDSTVHDIAGNSIVLSGEAHKDPKNGANLQLGLDSQIQYWAEQELAKGVSYAKAPSGSLLVMDTHTGAIRAWVDYPSYDASHYSNTDISLFKDDNVADLYEPGSVMKVVTFAGGLNTNAITPALSFNEGPQTIDGFKIQDWDNKAHGVVNMLQVLEQSLNNGAIHVMQLMGKNPFYANLLAFGMGSPTGVDLAGEANQQLPPESAMSDVNFATASFGQGIITTPVEMLAAINAVANGGIWVQPHAVESITDPNTGSIKPVMPTTRRVMSATAAATLSHMMTGVVEDHGGSGFLAKIPTFKNQIAAKTGTAQVVTNGQYVNGDVIDSFAGFLPVSNPQFTMLMIVRHPQENSVAREGAYLAAPPWKDLAQIIIDHWRITP